MEIIPMIPYIGVVFPFMASQWLDCYHFYFLTILKEALTFLSLINLVLQYSTYSADVVSYHLPSELRQPSKQVRSDVSKIKDSSTGPKVY